MMYLTGHGVAKDQRRGIELLKMSANKSNSSAITQLGIMFLKGTDVEQNVDEGLKYLRAGADKGNGLALYWLGVVYRDGIKVQADATFAFDLFKQSYEAGNASGGLEYAKILLESSDQKTRKTGFIVISKLASSGDPTAQYLLGIFYLEGTFSNKDLIKAQKFLLKSAEAGNKQSKAKLDELYLSQNVEPIDSAYKIKVLRAKAENGDIDSMINLADCYFKGINVQTDKKQAEKLYLKAAESGNIFAQKTLGIYYERGDFGRTNYEAAIKWYSKAAENGDQYSMMALAKVYSNSTRTTSEKQQAQKLYLELAEKGNVEAQYQLALISQDMRWMEKAADNGHIVSQFLYGQSLYEGNGVKKDVNLAIHYFQMASSKQHIGSCQTLAMIYLSGIYVNKNVSAAKDYLLIAARQDDPTSMYLYAEILESESSNLSECSEAFEWFKRAGIKGSDDAKWKVAEYLLCGYGKKKKDLREAAKWYRGIVLGGDSRIDLSVEYNRLVDDSLKASLVIDKLSGHFDLYAIYADKKTETIKQKIKVAEEVTTECISYDGGPVHEYEISRTPVYKDVAVNNTYLGSTKLHLDINEIVPFAI